MAEFLGEIIIGSVCIALAVGSACTGLTFLIYIISIFMEDR